MLPNVNEITLTFVENPSRFFFRFHDNLKFKCVKDYERNLQSFLSGRDESKAHSPNVGTIVAFRHERWKKWIRAKIVEKNDKKFRLFFIDHGHFHFSNGDLHLFAEIPEKMQRDTNRIKVGTLGLQPGSKVIDRQTLKPETCWNDGAIRFLRNLFDNRENFQIYFDNSGEFLNKMLIGDLIIKTKNSDELKSLKEEMIRNFWALDPSEVPPLNFGQIAAVVYPNLSTEEKEKRREVKKSPVMIPAGSSVQEFISGEKKAEKLKEKQDDVFDIKRKSENEMLKAIQLQETKDLREMSSTLQDAMGSHKCLMSPTDESSQFSERTSRPPESTKISLKSPQILLKSSRCSVKSSQSSGIPSELSGSSPVPTKLAAVQTHPMENSKKSTYSPEKSPPASEKYSLTLEKSPPAPKSSLSIPTSHQEVATNFSSKYPSAPQVQNMFVYGHSLKPAVQNISRAKFDRKLAENLAEINSVTTRVQAQSWGNLNGNRSMVIVAKDKNDATLAYLPVILNSLTQIHSNFDEVGPRAIIVAKTSMEVVRITNLISRLSNLTVVQVHGKMKKTVDVMNGCDLLVATPKSLQHVINEMFQYFTKLDRLKYVVVDGVDEMMANCDQEVKFILSSCFKGRGSELQLVMTAGKWFRDIDMLVTRSMMKDVVLCVEEFIEAAVCVNSDFSMEICKSSNEKVAKLVDALKNKTYKSQRTLVVMDNPKEVADELWEANFEVTIVNEKNVPIILRELHGNFTLLLADDATLQNIELRCVQNLIHFLFPRTWEVFERRFEVMASQLYAHKKAKTVETLPKTKIFLDDQNIRQFVRLVDFFRTRNIVKDSDKTAVDAKKIMEISCKLNAQICSCIFLFGECKKLMCQYRHTLNPTSDQPLPHLPTSSITNFELVSVKSPTSFVVKILSHAAGGIFVSWSAKNEKIKEFIEKSLQEFKGEKAKAVNIGEIYAVKKDDKWHRARIVAKPNPLVANVYLIDIGTTTVVRMSNLFDLPDDYKAFDPLVCKLQVTNLVPIDGEEFWSDESTEECREILQPMVESCTFTCKTLLAIHDTIFTETFDAKDQNLGKVQLRFKVKMLKEEICCEEPKVLKKLKNLVGKEDERPKNEVKTAKKEIQVQSPKKTEKLEIPQECWKKLSWNSHYELAVKHFKNPESFLAVPDISDSRKVLKALQEIENFPTKIPLEKFEVGGICGVACKKFHRGKIMKILEDAAMVLLVDTGEIVKCQKSELFQLPLELISKIPFQVVHCQMRGIKPKYNMNVWPPKQCQAVRELIMSCRQPLKAFVTRNSEGENEFGANSYEMFLINPETGAYLDEIAIEKKIADCDEKGEKPTDEDSGNVSDGDERILYHLLMKQHLVHSEDEEIENDEEEIKNEKREIKNEVEESDTKKIEVILPAISPPTTLDFIHKHPKIEWRQNDVMIYLLIAAVDCEDYSLVIDDSSLEVTIKYKSNLIEKAAMDFFSLIDSKLCSHEVRGLNIVLRLPKKFAKQEWPQLTESKEISKFLNYVAEDDKRDFELWGSIEKAGNFYEGIPDGLQEEESFSDTDEESWE